MIARRQLGGITQNASLGMTHASYYGTRGGIVRRTLTGEQVPVRQRDREWATEEQPSVYGALGEAERGWISTTFDYWWDKYQSGFTAADKYKATKKNPPSGYYQQGGYIYQFNGVSGSVVIVLSPLSAAPNEVKIGTDAWGAIVSAIADGRAKKVTANDVARLRAARRASPTPSNATPAPSVSRAQTTVTDVDVSTKDSSAPGAGPSWLDDSPTWLPWAVGGVAALGAVLLLWPRSPTARVA